MSTAALVFLAIVLSTEVLLHFHEREAISERRAASLAFASQLRARVDRELNAVLYLSSGLSSYLVVRHQQLNQREMRDILATLHGNSRHIRNFSVAIGHKVAYVHPLVGNEKIVGIDYREITAQWPAIKLAIESAKGTLTGPVQLLQGGTAFIYRTPILVNGQYWGLLSTVIDSHSFFDAAFREIDSERYEFAIRSGNASSAETNAIWGDMALFSDSTATRLEVEVPNGKWFFAVRPRQASGTSMLVWIIRIMGWLLALLSSVGVGALLRQRSELARHAGFDSLTNLPNRRLFDDRLDQAIRRHTRNENQQIGILFIDLDDFKEINDRYGHKVGDITLRTTALRIHDEVRISDTVARWGGDEFVVIIEEADADLMNQLTERLRQHVGKPFEAEGKIIEIAASFGSALYPGDASTLASLLELADQRMYTEKQRHKDVLP
ncbi:diguanylate cyclase domain-containing protein [Formivibrio citricus]|uniref:diguanylate cyclase domain-containing protein n=1 Tax=Formivibrio citricus TaxID=83765 RepID=UPI0015A50472|nr:diguanylate cyclase [Formivibrio citricus]